MKIPVVDKSRCISCGLCVSIASAVFRFGDDGKSEAHAPSGASEQTVQQAIDGCPVECISWQEQ